MTLRELLIERIQGAFTEEDLQTRMLTIEDLTDLSDVDLFELYEDVLFEKLL
jgi:hypothetical protein